MAKRRNKNYAFPGKPILVLIFSVVCIITTLNLFRLFFTRSAYFTITGVAIEGVQPDAFLEFKKRLVGKNIFLQDLKAIKKQIEELADIECVVISRRLPGELVFKLRKRVPLAQLKLTRYHLVDQAGMFIAGASEAAYDNLPVILGMEKKNSQGKARQYYPGAPELSLALELIKEKNNAPALTDYRITKISVLNQKASSFFLVENFPEASSSPEGDKLKKNTPLAQIEIKFDLQKPVETMSVLGALLDKLQAPGNRPEGLNPLEGIEYIDLRNINSPVVMEKKKNKQ